MTNSLKSTAMNGCVVDAPKYGNQPVEQDQLSIEEFEALTKQVSEVAEVRMGFHIRGSVREELGGNALLLQIRDVDTEGRFDEKSLISIDVPNLENHSLRSGDVVFLARGVRRFAFLFEGSLSDAIVPASYFMVPSIRLRFKVKSRQRRLSQRCLRSPSQRLST